MRFVLTLCSAKGWDGAASTSASFLWREKERQRNARRPGGRKTPPEPVKGSFHFNQCGTKRSTIPL